MPAYEFRTDEGEIVELHFTMEKVPGIGEVILYKGRSLKRVFGGVRGEHITHQHSKYPRLSHSMTPWTPGCETAKDPRSGKLKPIIKSRQHERELMARHGLVRD